MKIIHINDKNFSPPMICDECIAEEKRLIRLEGKDSYYEYDICEQCLDKAKRLIKRETGNKVLLLGNQVLPCPFCGEQYHIELHNDRVHRIEIVCTNCGASIQGETETEAINKWEERA